MLKYYGLNYKLPLSISCGMLPSAEYHLREKTFIDILSTIIESLLVDPDCCVLLIGDFDDHSVGKRIQLQTNVFEPCQQLRNYRFEPGGKA